MSDDLARVLASALEAADDQTRARLARCLAPAMRDVLAAGQASRWLTAEDAAEHLGVHVRTVYAWARSGRLCGRRVGRGWRFTLADLDDAAEGPERPQRAAAVSAARRARAADGPRTAAAAIAAAGSVRTDKKSAPRRLKPPGARGPRDGDPMDTDDPSPRRLHAVAQPRDAA